MDKKRVNYTAEEKRLLVELVEQYKLILENKETNAASNLEKEKTWTILKNRFNSKNLNVFRDSNSLRKQWAHVKMDIRKKAAKQRQQTYQTGGGQNEIVDEANSDLVLSIIQEKTVFGMENQYDADFTNEYPSTSQEVITEEIQSLAGTNNSIEPTIEFEIQTENNYQQDTCMKTPNWSSRRKPIHKIGPVEEAKIEVLHAQRDLLLQEKEHKEKMFQLEYEHKKKIFIQELNKNCNCKNK